MLVGTRVPLLVIRKRGGIELAPPLSRFIESVLKGTDLMTAVNSYLYAPAVSVLDAVRTYLRDSKEPLLKMAAWNSTALLALWLCELGCRLKRDEYFLLTEYGTYKFMQAVRGENSEAINEILLHYTMKVFDAEALSSSYDFMYSSIVDNILLLGHPDSMYKTTYKLGMYYVDCRKQVGYWDVTGSYGSITNVGSDRLQLLVYFLDTLIPTGTMLSREEYSFPVNKFFEQCSQTRLTDNVTQYGRVVARTRTMPGKILVRIHNGLHEGLYVVSTVGSHEVKKLDSHVLVLNSHNQKDSDVASTQSANVSEGDSEESSYDELTTLLEKYMSRIDSSIQIAEFVRLLKLFGVKQENACSILRDIL